MIKDIINFINTDLEIDITKKTKTNEYVFARTVYYKLAKEHTKLSLQEIGAAVNKDHCSVIHNLKNFKDAISRPRLKRIYETFKEYPIKSERLEYTQAIQLNEQLRTELINVKQQYNELLKSTKNEDITKLEELTQGLDEQQIELIYTRLSAMVKMM